MTLLGGPLRVELLEMLGEGAEVRLKQVPGTMGGEELQKASRDNSFQKFYSKQSSKAGQGQQEEVRA